MKKRILLVFLFIAASCSGETIHFKGREYKVVISPFTSAKWLDRNLGAYRVCKSHDDELCFGDYYQWGRKTNGHEKKESKVIYEQLIYDIDKNAKFIAVEKKIHSFDWRLSRNNKLWSGKDGKNPICPKGYRVPTQEELYKETVGLDSNRKVVDIKSAFDNFLKIPASGFKSLCKGTLGGVGSVGALWSSSTFLNDVYYLDIKPDNADMSTGSRAEGLPVRCIKDTSKK